MLLTIQIAVKSRARCLIAALLALQALIGVVAVTSIATHEGHIRLLADVPQALVNLLKRVHRHLNRQLLVAHQLVPIRFSLDPPDGYDFHTTWLLLFLLIAVTLRTIAVVALVRSSAEEDDLAERLFVWHGGEG